MPKPLADGLDYASRGGALKRARSRRAVRRLTAHARQGALNRLERVTLGGASHTLLTRSSGQDQAVALYIHGFLDPALAAARRVGWASGLEDQFTVVYWERRGYASAYRRGLDASTMTLDQATDDAVELIDILVARHDRSDSSDRAFAGLRRCAQRRCGKAASGCVRNRPRPGNRQPGGRQHRLGARAAPRHFRTWSLAAPATQTPRSTAVSGTKGPAPAVRHISDRWPVSRPLRGPGSADT
jgi:hypothetical protein